MYFLNENPAALFPPLHTVHLSIWTHPATQPLFHHPILNQSTHLQTMQQITWLVSWRTVEKRSSTDEKNYSDRVKSQAADVPPTFVSRWYDVRKRPPLTVNVVLPPPGGEMKNSQWKDKNKLFSLTHWVGGI